MAPAQIAKPAMIEPRRQARKRHFRAQWRILGFALLALGGAIAYNLYREHARIEAAERMHLSTQAGVLGQNIARQLDLINRAMAGIRDDLPRLGRLKDGRERAVRHLKVLCGAMAVRTMLVMDARGIVTASNREQFIGYDFGYRDYFQAPLRDPNPEVLYLSPPFRTTLGVFTMGMSRVVAGPNGEFSGIVAAILDPGEFDVLMNSVRYAPDMWLYLTHGDGRLFMMRPEWKGAAGMDLDKPDTFFSLHRDSGKPANVMSGFAHASGDGRMVALRTIQPPALRMNRPMVIAAARELPAIFAAWRRDVYAQGGLYGALVLASVLGLFLHQRRQRDYDRLAASQEAERKQADEALQLSKASVTALLDNTPYLMWLKDTDSRYVAANKAFVRFAGKTSVAEIIGGSDFDLFPKALAERYRAEDAEVMATLSQKLVEKQETHLGRTRWMETFKTPILSQDGRLLGTAGFAQDISARRERERQRLADEVAYRDDLVRELHHRIKNNLQSVAGLLRLELGAYPEMNPRLEMAICQVHAIAAVHGLQGADPEEAIPLGDTLCEICHAVEAQFQRPVVFRAEGPPLHVVKDEAVAVALVLNELVLNAVKHTPQGGAEPVVELRAGGGHARISIRNALSGTERLDFTAGRGGNTGLRLVRSLLPKEGAELSYEKGGARFMVTRLVLTAPVVAPV